MTTTTTSPETIEHLDFDTPCSVGLAKVTIRGHNHGIRPCSRPAAWDLRCLRCGRAMPICTHHKEILTNFLPQIRCVACGLSEPASFVIIPIGGTR